MSAQTKKTLFITFTILFFVSIPVMILLTQGYRIDFAAFRVVKTGGIDVEIETIDARVFVDGKFKKETNFLFRNAVFRNILPNEYTIRIEKNGYRDWEKKALVTRGQVTKFPAIRLFPNTLRQRVMSEDPVENLAISPNKNVALFTQATHSSSDSDEVAQASSIQLLNIERGSGPKPLITLRKDETIQSLRWADAGSVFYIHTRGPLGQKVYTGSVDKPDTLIDWSAFLRRSYIPALAAQSRIIPSNNPSVLWVLVRQDDGFVSISELNIDKGIIRPNIVSNIVASQIVRENLFYLDKKGTLARIHLPTASSTTLSPTAITNVGSQGAAHIMVREDQQAILIINRGDLFLWRDGEALIKIGANVDQAQFSLDNKKLIFWNQSQGTIYWLEEVFGPPKREKGSIEVIDVAQGIRQVHWLGKEQSHIVIQTNDELLFSELDSRDHRNTVSYPIALYASGSNNEMVALNNEREVIYGILLPEKKFVLLDFQ